MVRCVKSVSVHCGKLCTMQTVLSSGERGTLHYINMSDVCLCACACIHACSVSLCAVATAAYSLNILLSALHITSKDELLILVACVILGGF